MRRAVVLAALFVFPLCAQKPFEFWPGTQYDPRVPGFLQTLGYEPGAQITSSADILRYLDALAGASSRIKIFPYGETWEKRRLVYAAVGSDANL